MKVYIVIISLALFYRLVQSPMHIKLMVNMVLKINIKRWHCFEVTYIHVSLLLVLLHIGFLHNVLLCIVIMQISSSLAVSHRAVLPRPHLNYSSEVPLQKYFFLAINNFVYITPMFNRAGRNNYDDDHVFCFKITLAEAEIQVCACIHVAHLYYRSVKKI